MQILLDNVQYSIGQPLPEKISYCVIHFHPMELTMIQFPVDQKSKIIKWFETIKDKAEMLFLNDLLYQQRKNNEV